MCVLYALYQCIRKVLKNLHLAINNIEHCIYSFNLIINLNNNESDVEREKRITLKNDIEQMYCEIVRKYSHSIYFHLNDKIYNLALL